MCVNIDTFSPPQFFNNPSYSDYVRNRVAVQLQKNLDRIRIRRLAERLAAASAPPPAPPPVAASSNSRTSGFLGGLPGQLPPRQARQKSATPADESEASSYEYYYETEEDEEDGSR